MINAEANSIAPNVWLGSYSVMWNWQFFDANNIKVLINCANTYEFMGAMQRSGIPIGSDTIVLSLDPWFNEDGLSESERQTMGEYYAQFNRTLQNYLSFFYHYNPNVGTLIHQLPQGAKLSINSPILAGNLKENLFNVNRMLKLLRVINPSIGVAILSPDGNSALSTAVAMSFYMDTYNFNFDASFRNLKSIRPSIHTLNYQFYDDLIIMESLKKFYQENIEIKQENDSLLTTNCKSKRKQEYISVGGEHKRSRN
ncbi:Piso0_003412 [Millerozyma farinosa CBS 7064]|uniref:Piso0_003412 protein n=1 Tax=Pichia sorbitophila (strain ATCC MYA-4447 / BCRC 22081 / CBS 7064 / NBRC 10061 / NRRL Y-12695) TaxID=559304 RepID=G8YJ04_PICSO|nr:Piso0_003412 [Millerozyma farinosa CBS 7064]CCE81064.1 Piso0_003412 [Millerozyma farinosa CBS 7064]